MIREVHTYHITDFISELTRVSYSDILVHVDAGNKSVFSIPGQIQEKYLLPFQPRFNQIYKLAQQYKKTSDIQSLCLAYSNIHWNYKGRELESPLFLIPLHCNWNKVKQEFQLILNQEQAFLNPFLVNAFEKEFDLTLSVNSDLSLNEQLLELQHFLQATELDFRICDFQVAGNFHHHRYEILKDLEELAEHHEANHLVRLILGHEPEGKSEHLALCASTCFPGDPDQQEIFRLIEDSDLVVQGPPGTGKSQVLSNLIVKLLHRGGKHLVLSEKKTALEVLEKKLFSKNIHHFVFISHSQSTAGDFIQHLKKTWQFLEKSELQSTQNFRLSEQHLQRYQLIFDKIRQIDSLGEHSLSFFQEFQEKASYDEIRYFSDLPTNQEWSGYKENLRPLFEQVKDLRIFGSIQQSALIHYSAPEETAESIRKKVLVLQEDFKFETLAELQKLLKLSVRVQLLENESSKKYYSWLSNAKNYRKFEKLKKTYLKFSEELALYSKEAESWLSEPGLSELESWQKILKTASWFKKRKVKNHLESLLKTKQFDPEIAVEHGIRFFGLKKQVFELEMELREIGIENPSHELALVDYIYHQVAQIDPNELNVVLEMTAANRKKILDLSGEIKELERDLLGFFHLNPDDTILEILDRSLKHLATCVRFKTLLSALPASLYKALKFASDMNGLEQLVLKSNWIRFASLFPELAEFTGQKLKNGLETISSGEAEEHEFFAREIQSKRLEQFQEFHRLLATPSARLKEDEKGRKKELKAGKAILVREFSKSKQHRSVRELLNSEAKLWIELLSPISLSTPGTVSKNFPLQENLFEFIVIDEASQLPLPNVLASLQRGKRLLIAGDSQQMSPGSFFSGALSSVDLLHQASYYLPNHHLKHHYRSIHSELISFSNRHFYQNELIVYPSPEKKNPPLRFHFVEDGRYEDRQNKTEAKQVAHLLEKSLSSGKTIGVVAFSEQQLACIWQQSSASAQQEILKRIDEKTLFFKALEQVQGEECEQLIISFGYGKNRDGDFHLRFGPLNQKTGVKRLNVLLTRAIESIDFFASVRASDFSISENEAINLLRLYLTELEREKMSLSFQLPFKIKAEIHGNQLEIRDVPKSIPNVEELKTFHQVMKLRGWEITYVL